MAEKPKEKAAVKDKLIVQGLPPLDGEYLFDLVAMNTIGDPECLTNREGSQMKRMASVLIGDLMEAVALGDTDVLVALAAIVLARHRKIVDEEQLWDAPVMSVLKFDFVALKSRIAKAQKEAEAEVAASPTEPQPEAEID